MKPQLFLCSALVLAGCAGAPGGGTATSGTAVSHATRTLGKVGAPVRVVHFSAPW
jgi:hypothetical protein